MQQEIAVSMDESARGEEGQPDRRRAPRAALRLNATIREPGRSRVGVRVIDISTHGCRIEATSGASPEQWVLLSIAGLETQYCRVVWQCHEFAGLEFATPLAEVVLDRLLQEQSLSEASIGELRDIAKRTHRLAANHAQGDPQVLADLSRKCALDAVVEGLRLSDARHSDGDAGGRPPR
jgi:hypothetical protein